MRLLVRLKHVDTRNIYNRNITNKNLDHKGLHLNKAGSTRLAKNIIHKLRKF